MLLLRLTSAATAMVIARAVAIVLTPIIVVSAIAIALVITIVVVVAGVAKQ